MLEVSPQRWYSLWRLDLNIRVSSVDDRGCGPRPLSLTLMHSHDHGVSVASKVVT